MENRLRVYLNLSYGKIDKITIRQNAKKLLEVSREPQERTVPVVVCTDEGLDLYHVYRAPRGRLMELRFRHAFNLIRTDLWNNYRLTFKGLMWGVGKSTEYKDDIWFAIGETLVMSATGVCSPTLEDYLLRFNVSTAPRTNLLERVREFVQA